MLQLLQIQPTSINCILAQLDKVDYMYDLNFNR